MSNTVITNYTDLNGPSTKTDNSVVVIVNKDGSLSVDQKLLGTLMGSDGSQAAGISVVRVGHEGRPDDATDSENEDGKVPHVTLSVDSYYDEPDSIIKYDSGAEMLQSLRIETRENSLIGFHNDHCYTPLTSPSQILPQKSESFATFDDPIIEITHQPPPKPVTTPKKISILDQKILPRGKKIILTPAEPSVVIKGIDALHKPLPVLSKAKTLPPVLKKSEPIKSDDQNDSSSQSSSGDSAPDRDSDSDYKESKDRSLPQKTRKPKMKPRILKSAQLSKGNKLDPKIASRLKANKNILRREIKEKNLSRSLILPKKQVDAEVLCPKESIPSTTPTQTLTEQIKGTPKQNPKLIRKEKKTPAHVSALLSDMTSLFSTPDVIRRVSTENKIPIKETSPVNKKQNDSRSLESNADRTLEVAKALENMESKTQKPFIKKIANITDKVKAYDSIPQLDDASLAQILQDTTTNKVNPSITAANVINSPGLAGPLSPTLDLLAGLQPEEDGLTEDILMHVAQLVESSENLQEVLDKQVLGKVDTLPKVHQPVQSFNPQVTQAQAEQIPLQMQPQVSGYPQSPTKPKCLLPRKDPIEIVRKDGRVITLPPIEAPATRSSKRKTQGEPSVGPEVPPTIVQQMPMTPEPVVHQVQISKQYSNRKLVKKIDQPVSSPVIEKSGESQESWNSEDDPNRLWCICKQPHNNRFMICCDGCEDWFHGKCVNITKAMGQQMEEQGIEWRCPKCVKNAPKGAKIPLQRKLDMPQGMKESMRAGCIVCKKPARASSIYCSDSCILKHAQDSLGTKTDTPGKAADKASESRVIVYERKSGRLLAGPNAPTAENLKSWLQKNPTFEVVRPGTLSSIKPNAVRKKSLEATNKIQTTLNFTKVPRKETPTPKIINTEHRDGAEHKQTKSKSFLSPREQTKLAVTPRGTLKIITTREEPKTPQPKTPTTPKPVQSLPETPKSSLKNSNEVRKRALNRSQLSVEKAIAVSQPASRRKDSQDKKKMDSEEEIRENVKKSLQEQISIRMSENEGNKLTEDEIQQYAIDTEIELFELFNHDVGMKYKAKYRSLMFNIKDRKNLSLWRKICENKLKPSELVRLSPEELASQELAQWREEESKHQLELIKKSEIDLLAASKTYVLKTHKGEEVMEKKESVQTELDPNVPVEEIVTALNVAVGDGPPPPVEAEVTKTKDKKKSNNNRKKDKEKKSSHSKKHRETKRESEKRKSRSSRSEVEREHRTRRSKKTRSSRSESKERKLEKEKNSERRRSRSRGSKSKKRSRDRSRSESRGRDRDRERSGSRDSTKRRRRSRSTRKSIAEEKHRSRSQDNVTNKNDSTDSDSIERPKSAMMKEVHPEYDPHEPMITSAFSEDDLHKSREDTDEETYKNEISEYGNVDISSIKSFAVDSDIPLPPPLYKEKPAVEVESDQEPSSTVDNATVTVWNGCINMVDVARFYVAAHEVSGNAVDLEDDLSAELDIVGRINPDTVWDYIGKMKRTSNKDIVILRLQAANDEERMQYIALYSYLSSRNRLGVVKVTNTATVKDFYILPLSANKALPPVLLPLDGPGLGDVKTHLLIAIIIRQRKKRPPPHIPKDLIPAKLARESRKKSYTPPLSPRNRPMNLPYTSSVLSSTVKDKIAASLAAADDDEPYSPGSSNSSTGATSALPTHNLRNKMEELNRQIEEQKQQIFKMAQADSSVQSADNEAYSPSRPLSPAPRGVPLADIALPSNLQEILATIKQRSESAADVDMRTNLP